MRCIPALVIAVIHELPLGLVGAFLTPHQRHHAATEALAEILRNWPKTARLSGRLGRGAGGGLSRRGQLQARDDTCWGLGLSRFSSLVSAENCLLGSAAANIKRVVALQQGKDLLAKMVALGLAEVGRNPVVQEVDVRRSGSAEAGDGDWKVRQETG